MRWRWEEARVNDRPTYQGLESPRESSVALEFGRLDFWGSCGWNGLPEYACAPSDFREIVSFNILFASQPPSLDNSKQVSHTVTLRPPPTHPPTDKLSSLLNTLCENLTRQLAEVPGLGGLEKRFRVNA